MAIEKFTINLLDKPSLLHLAKTNVPVLKEVIGTFVGLMEVAAKEQWHELPKSIHTSLSFQDIITGVLNAIMTTREIDPKAHATLEADLHPLSLLSDQRESVITGERELYDWRSHFLMDTNEVSRETLEKIIRKMLYLMRWFDVESVSKALITREFPIMDDKDIEKLPFQPALKYQKEHLGELYVGKFWHDIGAFNCGTIGEEEVKCPSCAIGDLKVIDNYKVCSRCNGGWKIENSREEIW